MSDLRKIVENRKNYQHDRESKYKQESKDRLSKILKKKIQTTMIGALSSIEEHFGFLWDENNGNTKEQNERMKQIYEQVRSEILDKGNNQSRNVDAELSQYNVEWLKYQLKIPVITKPEEKSNG